MRGLRKILTVVLCLSLTAGLWGCANADNSRKDDARTLTVAYQGGVGYAPVHVMEVKNLIEENYEGEILVEFVKLDSGAAINEGIIGGTIDIGCMGLAPAISGVAAGIPYKVISNLCSQSHGLMSNDKEITKLAEITSEDKVALVSTGSIQHILLAMAAEKEFGDAHTLDNHIQGMSHAEGMAALESGTVKMHLTSSPFIYQERESGKYTELTEINEVWPSGNTFLVAMASTAIENDAELFAAVENAFAQAIEFINTNQEETAQIEVEYLNLDIETVESYLNQEDCQFFSEIRGAQIMADFMHRAGFVSNKITMEDFKYESVNGN